jgi:hypothetical protein
VDVYREVGMRFWTDVADGDTMTCEDEGSFGVFLQVVGYLIGSGAAVPTTCWLWPVKLSTRYTRLWNDQG